MLPRLLRLGIAGAALTLAPGMAVALERVGTFDTPSTTRDVAFAGGLVYVADGSSGLRILDVSSPALPVEVGALDPPTGVSQGVAVVGGRAYLADSTAGLRIVDVTTPSAPSPLGEVLTGGSAERVAVAGGLAYVAANFGGLVIVDVSNPAAPAVIGSVSPGASARGVAVSGTRAYVTVDQTDCVVVVDVSNPAAPSVIGPAFDLITNCRSPELVGGAAFVSFSSGLGRYELSDPDEPAQLPSALATSSARALDVVGSLAYLSTDDGAEIFDVSGALAPPATLLGTLPASGSSNHVELLGSHVYLANRNTGSVEVVDVSDPAHPVSRDSVLAGADFSALDVVSSGGQVRIYAAESLALWVIDATDPGNLIPIGQEPLADFGSAVEVVGSLAYVGDGSAGLKIIDVSNPTNPAPRGGLNTPGFVSDIQVVGQRAYLADSSSASLRIVDVSNPDLPLPLGAVTTPGGSVNGVEVRDGLAYLADGEGGLRIFNVNDPASPVPLGQLVLENPTLTEHAHNVDVVGTTAYVITTYALWIIDVSDPAAPVAVTRIDYENSPSDGGEDVVVAGGKAYVARLAGGLTGVDLAIWDVSLPGGLGPAPLASVFGFSGGGGVAADHSLGLVAVAAGPEGVHLLDASDELAAHPCLDGIDNDGDAAVDAADAGCEGGDDPSEQGACSDGLDNDGDGGIDFGPGGGNDPGCGQGVLSPEDPQCQDGVDNDGDGATDHPADTRCRSKRDDDELLNPPGGCGLGFEIALALLALGALRRRRG